MSTREEADMGARLRASAEYGTGTDRTSSSDGRGASPQYMPIADAIADAETLRINMLYGSIFDATYGMGEDFTERDAKRQAIISAHAIFLACPGLRE